MAEPRLVPGSAELIDELVVAHYEALDRVDAERSEGDAPSEGGAMGGPGMEPAGEPIRT